jgi:hypothetical protein
VRICEDGAFTRDELEYYDEYLDHVRIELDLADTAKGHEKLKKAIEEKEKTIEEQGNGGHPRTAYICITGFFHVRL